MARQKIIEGIPARTRDYIRVAAELTQRDGFFTIRDLMRGLDLLAVSSAFVALKQIRKYTPDGSLSRTPGRHFALRMPAEQVAKRRRLASLAPSGAVENIAANIKDFVFGSAAPWESVADVTIAAEEAARKTLEALREALQTGEAVR